MKYEGRYSWAIGLDAKHPNRGIQVYADTLEVNGDGSLIFRKSLASDRVTAYVVHVQPAGSYQHCTILSALDGGPAQIKALLSNEDDGYRRI